MLKTISAALIATSLIAAPALAANSGNTVGTATQTQTQAQPTADTNAQAPKAAKVTSTKSKKLHANAKTIRHHSKKISMHKSQGKVASKVSTKPTLTATKRS